MKSDYDIIKDCLEGDQLAYKKLYERYSSYCYGICRRYDVHQSEIKDIVQIIFMQTFKSLGKYDLEKSQFKTWFTRICINNILAQRKRKINQLSIQDFDDINELDIFHVENNIESSINKEFILHLIKKMPSSYQLVFNMFIFDDYSHEEISKKLNISLGASRVILNRARNWVKKKLANHLISHDERA